MAHKGDHPEKLVRCWICETLYCSACDPDCPKCGPPPDWTQIVKDMDKADKDRLKSRPRK